MAIDEFGKSVPSLTPLDDDAAALLEGFGAEIQARESKAHGTLKSAMGKARGQALRLALVLEYLWWCPHETRMEPVSISSEAMQAAIRLMTDYFLPMAARVLGAASVPQDERDARVLARWIAETGPARINVSAIRDDARLSGLRDTLRVKGACRFLEEAGWVTAPPRERKSGRPPNDYEVNPQLWDMLPARSPSP